MIEEILPPVVAAADAFEDPPDAMLFPEEEAIIRNAVEKRRREFTTARMCARAALAKLGLPQAPIMPGTGGAPQWPSGVVGSMTHCADYRASAVARARDVVTIGLDAEPHDTLPRGVLDLVSVADERVHLRELWAAAPEVCWDRLLFSAKESVYKAWFPLTERWLDFEEASVTVDPVGGTFVARLLVQGPMVSGKRLNRFTGRWLVWNGLIVTAIVVPAPDGYRPGDVTESETSG